MAASLQVTMQKSIYSTSWVKMDGTMYRVGQLVCSKMEHEMPVFCKITKIIVVTNVYLLLDKLHTDNFSEHYNAFTVFDGVDDEVVVKVDHLKFYKPFVLQSADESLYVVR